MRTKMKTRYIYKEVVTVKVYGRSYKGKRVRKGHSLNDLIWMVLFCLITVMLIFCLILLFNCLINRNNVAGAKIPMSETKPPERECGSVLPKSEPIQIIPDTQYSDYYSPPGIDLTKAHVFTAEEVDMMAKVLYNEAWIVDCKREQAAVVWVMLNRLDCGIHGDTIKEVVTYPEAFAWDPSAPVEQDMLWMVRDVIGRWNMERIGCQNVGRVIPSDYLYFYGDGEVNHFMNTWPTGVEWDWSLPDPYAEG